MMKKQSPATGEQVTALELLGLLWCLGRKAEPLTEGLAATPAQLCALEGVPASLWTGLPSYTEAAGTSSSEFW